MYPTPAHASAGRQAGRQADRQTDNSYKCDLAQAQQAGRLASPGLAAGPCVIATAHTFLYRHRSNHERCQ
jgi:hypothetical protein